MEAVEIYLIIGRIQLNEYKICKVFNKKHPAIYLNFLNKGWIFLVTLL